MLITEFFRFNIIFWSFFPLYVPIFCAEPRHKRISTAIGARAAGGSRFFRLIKTRRLYKKWRQLSSIDAIWLVCDLDGTNFYTFYGGFEAIGLLYLVSVFHWLYKFGLDVLLGIETKIYLISQRF
jgi:hypothetical protein